jgi:hypothetical protein
LNGHVLTGGWSHVVGATYKPASGSGETVTETIEIVLEGTPEQILADIEQMEDDLVKAKVYQDTRFGSLVYLEAKTHEDESTWRTELIGGRVERSMPNMVSKGALIAALIIERVNYWESEAGTLLPLSNPNGTDVTTGIHVFAGNDGKMVGDDHLKNYVDIDGDDVGGTLPGRVDVRMTVMGTETSIQHAMLGLNYNSEPATLQHTIEGEDATWGATEMIDVDASGMAVGRLSWASGDTWTLAGTWNLSAAQTIAAKGNWFRILGRLVTACEGLRTRVVVSYLGTEIGRGGDVTLSDDLTVTFGHVRIPPWMVGVTSQMMEGVTLELWVYDPDGAGTMEIDYLTLLCIDGLRDYLVMFGNLGGGETLIDGLDWCGIASATGYARGSVLVIGEMYLKPKTDQRLVLVLDNAKTVGVSMIARYYARRGGL